MTKLTPEQVVEIRRAIAHRNALLRRAACLTDRILAEKHGCCERYVRKVAAGYSRKLG